MAAGADAGRSPSPYVDYDRHATSYRHGRGLSATVLDLWRDAVAGYLPTPTHRVADVGAGTGIFARAWPAWTGGAVVAVEPVAAMLAEAERDGPGLAYLQGVAEALPLRSASVDVVWVSTALHHFADTDGALAEFVRILRVGGRVLVRALVPGRTEITAVDQFPGRERWEARFPGEPALTALFHRHGFEVLGITEVLEGTETFADSADWVSRMRNVDSLFTALGDEEIDEGLRRLRASPDRVGRHELTLLAFGTRHERVGDAGSPRRGDTRR